MALHDVAEKTVLELVADGSADLGVGTVPEDDTELAGTRLITDEFLVVLHPTDPLVRIDELRWTDLIGRTLIGPHRGNPIRDRLESELALNGIVLPFDKSMQEVALPLTIIGMVEAGLGAAIMTSAIIPLATSMNLIVRTPTEPHIKREVGLIQKRATSLSPAAKRFRDFLLKSVH